ncbi:NADH-quinone oxidoreductase subunit NuoH [Pseudactinotalea sp. HY158]|uniref:NADH-quinone oxidoreductase subunit NuoH n=1 Tax=unclassified Pseudactinotalea TaxID=2649176 RepID=UPI00351A1AC1
MMNLAPILAQAPRGADFSNDTVLVSLIKAVCILLFLLLSVLLALWFERRLIGRFQQRLGPNVRGPFGLVQSIPDALKLVLKEDITVKAADKVIYIIAPLISVVSAFLIFAVIPFGPEREIFGVTTPLQLTDMPVAVLYILAIAALGVYGIVLGGWSSGSTYPLLGAVRSTAQVISYELGMGLSLVSVFIVSGSMSTSEIVASQTGENGGAWWAIALFPAFVVYIISMVGETNRLPFDLPEAEGELVGGFQTEYSSMKFAWFYLAEYINMMNVSAIATTLFLGGWHAPFPFNYFSWAEVGIMPVVWFLVKLWLLMGFFVWLRGTLLRFRYDQFMNLGWKILIPIALAWVVIVSVYQGVIQFGSLDLDGRLGPLPLRTWIIIAAGVLLILAFALLAKEPRRVLESVNAEPAEPEEFDAFAGGYPVPPLPGQQLPPSPRRAKVTAPAGEKETDDV